MFYPPFRGILPSKCLAESRSRQLSISPIKKVMDFSSIASKLGLGDAKPLFRKAQELRRLCDLHFDSSVFGVGEICKGIICLEIAANRMQVLFDRNIAIRLSGMSEKAYIRSFNAIENFLGVKSKLDIRELGIRFGCARLIPFVQKSLSCYKDRFIAALPVARRSGANFDRPVFTAVAFYLSAKKHKLKIDKLKLIELCGTSESEFTNVSTSMSGLCSDVFGTKEKKESISVKGDRGILDACHNKRNYEELSDVSDDSSLDTDLDDVDDELEIPSYKRHKKIEKRAWEEWKSSVLSAKANTNAEASGKPMKQAKLNFARNGVSKKVAIQTSKVDE